jgi:hypothetical protein
MPSGQHMKTADPVRARHGIFAACFSNRIVIASKSGDAAYTAEAAFTGRPLTCIRRIT